MPVYRLGPALAFPPPEAANEDGVVAVGGDFSAARLLLAYATGIFPWPSEGLPLLWFSPDPRFVLEPSRTHVPRSLAKRIRKTPFEVRTDTAFEQVITQCQRAYRGGQHGTWITDELRDGYVELARQGYAHSVETYLDGKLVGGLYGVSLGGAFFGESMFALEDDASKVAFITFAAQLQLWGFDLIDCQVHTDNLDRFGAEEWPREVYLQALRASLETPTREGQWTLELTPVQAVQRLKDNSQEG